MMYLIAIVLPPLATLFAGRVLLSVVLIAAMATIVGWIPAALVALMVVHDRNRDKSLQKLAKAGG